MTHIFDQLLKAIAVMIIAMYSCVPPKNHIKYITDIPHMQIFLSVYPLTIRKVDVTASCGLYSIIYITFQGPY